MPGRAGRALWRGSRRALGVAIAGAALLLIAALFDAAPLFVPGVALIVLGLLAPPWVAWSARGAHVRRLLEADRVLEGAALDTTLEVRRSFAPGGWGRLELLDPASETRVALGGAGSPLRGSRIARVRVRTRCPRRGEQSLPAPSLRARDPLGLAEAVREGAGGPRTILVLPRTEPVAWSASGSAGGDGLAGGAGRGDRLAATDLEGLRPYRPGTPASRIHWPALARGRGLLERRLQADADRRALVVLDTRTRPGGAEDLDRAVRAAASLVLELAGRGGCGLLLPGQSRPLPVDPDLAGWPAAHARLAVVGTPADPEAARAPSLGRGAPTIFWVAAVSHERLGAALSGGGRGDVVLVVPESEVLDGRPRGLRGRVRPVLAVGGCRGYALAGASARPRADREGQAQIA